MGRWFGVDPQNQFASPYLAMGNNPVMMVDPDGEFVTWNIGRGGFNIGFNLTPIGIPLGAGLNFGWRNGGSVGTYGEVGYRVGGTGLGSGATVSQSLDYGFRTGWSTTTSAGAYASYGMFNAGANSSYTYDITNKQGSFGWGVSSGINLGGNDAWGVGLTFGYGSGGWNYGAGGYYNPKAITRTLLKEYNLDGASPDALRQRDGYDCLICAVEYIEQGAFGGGTAYEDILNIFGDSYDPRSGTNTLEALEKIYGKGNVEGYSEVYPSRVGRQMEQGNPSVIAMNKNHAIVPTKIGIYNIQIGNNAPKMKFNITYMNPANGRFRSTGRVPHYRHPIFLIKFR